MTRFPSLYGVAYFYPATDGLPYALAYAGTLGGTTMNPALARKFSTAADAMLWLEDKMGQVPNFSDWESHVVGFVRSALLEKGEGL